MAKATFLYLEGNGVGKGKQNHRRQKRSARYPLGAQFAKRKSSVLQYDRMGLKGKCMAPFRLRKQKAPNCVPRFSLHSITECLLKKQGAVCNITELRMALPAELVCGQSAACKAFLQRLESSIKMNRRKGSSRKRCCLRLKGKVC